MKSVLKSIDRVLLKDHSVKQLGKSSECKKVLWPKLGRFHACSLRVKKATYTRGTILKNVSKNWPGLSKEELGQFKKRNIKIYYTANIQITLASNKNKYKIYTIPI